MVKFDEILQVPDGMSTKEFVQQQYGKIGVLVIELCGFKLKGIVKCGL